MSLRLRNMGLGSAIGGGLLGAYVGTLAHGVTWMEGFIGGAALGFVGGFLIAFAFWSIPFNDMGRRSW